MKTKNPKNWGNHRKLRNRINDKVKTAKASYYHNSFIQSKGNVRRTWKTIKQPHVSSSEQSNSKGCESIWHFYL